MIGRVHATSRPCDVISFLYTSTAILVDPGESSSSVPQPLPHPPAPMQPTAHSPPPEHYTQQVDPSSPNSIVHESRISHRTIKISSRTSIQKPTRHIPYSRRLAGLPDSITSLDLLRNLDRWCRRPPKPTITPFRLEPPSARTNKPLARSLKRIEQSRALPISLTATSTRVRTFRIPVSNHTFHSIHQRPWDKYISRDDWVTWAYPPQLPPGGNGSCIRRIHMPYEASPSGTYPFLCL